MSKSLVAAGLAALALLAGAVATPARAQQVLSLFYQEVERDGRIYVFNSPERFKSFSESGEIGTAITLIGRAEGGKTLVAENETAADLYFFKHDLPGYDRATPKPYSPPFDVTWKDGKTVIKSKNAELNLSNRLQVRYTHEDLDAGSATSGPERDSFRVRRMKTKMDGWAYTKNLQYELQLNFADSSNVLEDANVNYDFTGGEKAAMIKLGQYKVPFGRQELTSSGSQQFVDRSAVSNTFARGRDIGVQLWGTPAGGKLDWRVGVFNGGGRTISRNDNDDLQVNARLQWAPFGDPKYSEGDFDSSDKPLFSIAGNYESNTREVAATATAVAHHNAQDILGYDVVFKYKGFSLFGEYFDRQNDRNEGFSDFDDDGYNLQAGYFVIPKRLEVALRFAEYDPNAGRGDDVRSETGVALGYYWNKHNHKLQTDFREIEDEARGAKDKELRVQYQIIF
jgi:phosphate-selective porin OprO/OprP